MPTSMSELTIEPWLLLIPAILIAMVVILGFSRIRRSTKWKRERRTSERRHAARRTGVDRRSEVRQKHDELHNIERRSGERREGERRNSDSWKSEYTAVKEKLEEKQQDNRNA